MRYFVQIFRICQTVLSNDIRMKVEILQVSKIAFSGSGLFVTKLRYYKKLYIAQKYSPDVDLERFMHE